MTDVHNVEVSVSRPAADICNFGVYPKLLGPVHVSLNAVDPIDIKSMLSCKKTLCAYPATHIYESVSGSDASRYANKPVEFV